MEHADALAAYQFENGQLVCSAVEPSSSELLEEALEGGWAYMDERQCLGPEAFVGVWTGAEREITKEELYSHIRSTRQISEEFLEDNGDYGYDSLVYGENWWIAPLGEELGDTRGRAVQAVTGGLLVEIHPDGSVTFDGDVPDWIDEREALEFASD